MCERSGGEEEVIHQGVFKEDSRRASDIVFTIKGIPIENVRDFIYLGRMLSSSDEDWPDVNKNLVKARRKWDLISHVQRREGADPRITEMFYKAVVMTVLLF
jgi:hypothetical protein